jgi:hypothetical protein
MAKPRKPLTLAEHLANIQSKGGKAAMAQRSAEERTEFAKKGAKASAIVRAKKARRAKA